MRYLQLATYLTMLFLHISSSTIFGSTAQGSILALPKEVFEVILNQIYQDNLSNFKKISCYPDYTKAARSLCCINSGMYFIMRDLKIEHILTQYNNQNPFLRKAYIPPLRIQSSLCGGNAWIILCPNSETFYAAYDLTTQQLPKSKLLEKLLDDPDREVKCDDELKALQINTSRIEKVGCYPNLIQSPSEFIIALLENDITSINTILKDYSDAKEPMKDFLLSDCCREMQDLVAWLGKHQGKNQKFVEIEKLVKNFFENCLEQYQKEVGGNSNKSYFENPLLILIPLVPIFLSLLYLCKKPIMDIMLKNH